MILVADSGTTKTDWRTIDIIGNISQYKTSGINPNYMSHEAIKSIFLNELQPQIDMDIAKLYFYGSGCSSQKSKDIIKSSFQSVFNESKVEVQHDLIAAARSLCGRNEGIACILGTGANSCLYDGKVIVDNVPSIGFIMGDEGSGAWLGKELLAAFVRKELPQNISDKLVKRFNLSTEDIIENVYRRDQPSKYMSGFSKFIFQNLKEPYLYLMVRDGFTKFFEKNVLQYPDYKQKQVHFTGSVAFYYGNILRKVAEEHEVILRNVVENPIAGLTLFHQNSFS